MRICGLHIDGFGLFHDQRVDDIPSGLVLFTGNNESGKTTLMEFIRTILFGFPRRPRNDYPPLRGGNHGGRLQLAMEDGRLVTVERAGRRALIAEEGAGAGQAEPKDRLLGGIDRAAFEKVFAIGLDDLQGLGVLSQEGVSGRLFAAGAGLGASSVPGTVREIDDELKGLLSQRGSSQRINSLLDRLEKTGERIAQLRSQASEYARIERDRAVLRERIRAAQEEADGIRRRLRRVEQIRRAIEPWARLSVLRKKEEDLRPAAGFPPGGLDRLELLKAEIERLRLDRDELEEKANALRSASGKVKVDGRPLSHEEAIESLAAEGEKLPSVLRDYTRLVGDVDRQEAEYERRLRELGPGWDGDRLNRVDTSVQVRQRVQEFGRRLRDHERKYEEARMQFGTAEDSVREAGQKLGDSGRQLGALPVPPVKDPQVLRDRLEAAHRVRSLVTRRETLRVQLDAARDSRREVTRRLETLRGRRRAPVDPVPAWLPAAVLAAGLLAAGVMSVQGRFPPAVAAALTGLLLYLGLQRWRAAYRAEAGAFEAQLKADEEEAVTTGLGIQERINTLERQIAALDHEIDQAAAAAGEGPVGGIEEAERILVRLDRAREELGAWKELERRKSEAASALDKARNDLDAAQRGIDEARTALARVEEEWRQWLTARGFSESIQPEGFEAVLQAVESARTARRSLEDSRTRVMQWVAQLIRDLEETERSAKRIDELLKQKESSLDALLEQAGARNEDEFRSIAAMYGEWRNTRDEMERLDVELRTVAGGTALQADLEKELDGADPVALEAEDEALRAKLDGIQDAIARDTEETGRLEQRMDELGRDEEMGRLLLEENSVREEIAAAVRRWATLALCRSLLAETRDAYERERQPQVIQEADRFLKMMAGDRYRLISSIGEGSIELEDASLSRKGQAAWSRGLAEQVYLAIRLGLAREFGRRSEPLPVILDDVLVNFDPSRQDGAARLILEFARQQQVLLFSCHPEIEELIRTASREAQFSGVPFGHYSIEDGRLARVQ